jgi:hypothetical protein
VQDREPWKRDRMGDKVRKEPERASICRDVLQTWGPAESSGPELVTPARFFENTFRYSPAKQVGLVIPGFP